MRERKQETKDKIRRAIDELYKKHLRSPSPQDVAEFLGMDRTTVWRYIKEMDLDEQVAYKKRKAITTDITHKVETEQVSIPLAGSIPCGTPEEQEEVIETYFSFPRVLLGAGEFFMLKAQGDSMVDAGIESGDLVIIRRETEARVGQIVAALCDGFESTLKTLAQDSDGKLYLQVENHTYSENNQKIIPHSLSIQGIAVRVIKALE